MTEGDTGTSYRFSNFCNLACSSNTRYIFQCDADAAFHLAGLKSSEKIPGKAVQFHDCPEALLILYRSGILTIDTDSLNLKICQKHREYSGTKWRRGNARCIYPEHNNRKGRTDRGASPCLCKEYYLKTRQTIPVGSGKLNNKIRPFFLVQIHSEIKANQIIFALR